MVYYNCEIDSWTMPQTWVVNAADETCKKSLLESSNNRLGLDQTFFYTAIVFFITGMGFGTSYSLVHVDCLNWVHTDWKRKLARGLLGTGIAGGAYFAFEQIPCNDNPTRFFFLYALPALSISFFVFGVFPIICDKLGLVDGNQTMSAAISQDPLVKRTLIPATTEGTTQ
jgi:hypothetical protein